MKQEVLQPCAN